ncbi:antitoxin MazE5 [Serinicoccus sp. CUA-874]|uniref:type II toxin-antitoxin system VapB family antitoxin n=1 Tax=Serinicoccus sp. CUA-874 TaxID=1517939 RepID=UPI000959A6BA|nr:type II toxin-antitoxin system VapB family antitoxin [Serinicoccus sp. CUA-874]OLT16819.1 antitoxin MazE5 [Serinicoccus sp. CUA-874]
MARVRISTTVDAALLARARALGTGTTESSLVERALTALLREHRAAQIDREYAEGYARLPADVADEWGDVPAFLDAASRS